MKRARSRRPGVLATFGAAAAALLLLHGAACDGGDEVGSRKGSKNSVGKGGGANAGANAGGSAGGFGVLPDCLVEPDAAHPKCEQIAPPGCADETVPCPFDPTLTPGDMSGVGGSSSNGGASTGVGGSSVSQGGTTGVGGSSSTAPGAPPNCGEEECPQINPPSGPPVGAVPPPDVPPGGPPPGAPIIIGPVAFARPPMCTASVTPFPKGDACTDGVCAQFDACCTKWDAQCADFMALVPACDGRCPTLCNGAPAPPVGARPMRIDTAPTYLPKAPFCTLHSAFTAGLYAEPHYVAVRRTLGYQPGTSVVNFVGEIWAANQQATALAPSIGEPFWKLATDPVGQENRQKFQSGAAYANCLMYRLQSYGDLVAVADSLKSCLAANVTASSYYPRQGPSAGAVDKIVLSAMDNKLWSTLPAYRAFLISLATRLKTVYNLEAVIMVEITQVDPEDSPADLIKLSKVAYLAVHAYSNTVAISAAPDIEAAALARYQAVVTSYEKAGIDKKRLVLVEHYGNFEASYTTRTCSSNADCTPIDDKDCVIADGKKVFCKLYIPYGRAGIKQADWEKVLPARYAAQVATGVAGTMSYGWLSPLRKPDGTAYNALEIEQRQKVRYRNQRIIYGGDAPQ